MRGARRRSRSSPLPRSESLPVQALYRVGDLARVIGVSHRRLQKLLDLEAVRVYRIGRFLLVPLSELEEKMPALWESIKAAHTLRRALDDA